MKAIGIALALICTGLFLAPNAAQAQATRTWVSGVGMDTNPCSRTAPCQTFPGAISKTAAGGEIDTLDPGGFGAVTVVKAITIASEGTGEAGILVAGTNGVTVNCSTDPNCVVILRGLEIDGGPTGSNSLAGVHFIAGKTLIVQHCSIRNFTGGSPNGYGISFTPTGAGNLFVDDTTLVTNGQPGGTGGGIFIGPTGTPVVNVAIRNTQASNNNGFGIRVDTTGATGGTVALSVSDSETSGNANAGIAAVSGAGGTAVVVNVDHSAITHNLIGINGNGATATFRIGTSTIMNNATGVKQVGASTMTSYGTNQISDNPIAGFALPLVPPS
jgi:hypothetical protein